VPTWDTVRSVLAELPGTVEDPPGRMRAFRAGGKLVAFLPETDRSRPPHFGDDEVLVIRTGFDERAALIEEDPETFAVTPHYESYRGVLVRLRTVPADLLGELLTEAWRSVAARRLVRQFDLGPH
jgi:hypothetical protein